ncbi:NUDIX hydrolase [Clostridium intestinale]|uniref:NUDIX family hydrolase n=1 Tax=Clostridium intestinale URNW TaxID=1294142 RepID=U2Q425_9CLOT|nr:NUDIX domain-containing protein [Clostridium intestinale]ERK30849.1 NUDIX family hydrolase [Clostridium intestinale URNW]
MEYDCGFSREDKWFRYRATAIIIENGYVLFAGNEKDSYYYSIGGGVHIGESAEEAVKREVFEETGIHYEVERLAFIHENFFIGEGSLLGKKCHEIAFYYLMKSRGTRELDSNSYNTQGIKENMYWIPINNLSDYSAYPTFFREKLNNLKNEIEHIVTYE